MPDRFDSPTYPAERRSVSGQISAIAQCELFATIVVGTYGLRGARVSRQFHAENCLQAETIPGRSIFVDLGFVQDKLPAILCRFTDDCGN